jgi:hypothetical protein
VTGSALAFGATETAAGWAPTYAAATVPLAGKGFASIYFTQAANHRTQLGSDPRYRGRVLAVYTLIMQGSTPLGALLICRPPRTWGPGAACRWAAPYPWP